MQEFNPETGELEDTNPAALAQRATMKRSYKKNSDKGYKATVTLDGHLVYLGLVEKEDVMLLPAADAENHAEMERIQALTKPTTGPDGRKGKPKIDLAEARKRSMAAVEARQQVYYDFLKKTIIAWELPDDEPDTLLPCTPEAIENLPFEAAYSLAMSISQSTTLGKEINDFLATK